jgi:hypothetical protein
MRRRVLLEVANAIQQSKQRDVFEILRFLTNLSLLQAVDLACMSL